MFLFVSFKLFRRIRFVGMKTLREGYSKAMQNYTNIKHADERGVV